MKQFLTVAVPILIAVVGCADRSRDMNDMFGGKVAIETVRNATTVNAYRLTDEDGHRDAIADYKTAAGPVAVPAAAVSSLKATLLDHSSYEWDVAKGCEPVYGVRIEFQHGSDTVDVLFCFACDILAVYHNGKSMGGEDFDNVRGTFVKIVKDLFPDDEKIQALK